MLIYNSIGAFSEYSIMRMAGADKPFVVVLLYFNIALELFYN